jgi:hypothetical protein
MLDEKTRNVLTPDMAWKCLKFLREWHRGFIEGGT